MNRILTRPFSTCLAFLAFSLTASGYPAGKTPSEKANAKTVEADAPSDSKRKERKKGEKKANEKPAPEKHSGKKASKPTKAEKSEEKSRPESIGHPFSWPFVGWEGMKPRGGTTKGSETKLATEANPAFYRIQERGISPKERDRRAILALAGDYRVSFDFIETASSAFPYEPPRPYFSWGTECAFVIEDQPNFISIQHILVMEFVDANGETQGPFTMKHWRQDWTYQDTNIFSFLGDRTWQSETKEKAPGQWSQAVYQVDDSPRYETTGRWDHRGGISVFRSRPFWRPLPRREFSVRDDYNVLGGYHEITVTPGGWIQTQINRKIVGKDGKIKKVMAHELGASRYERISSPSLAPAHDYWKATAPLWSAVRKKWNKVLSGDTPVHLRKSVDDKPMYAHLFALAGQLEKEGADKGKAIKQAMKIIDRFIELDGE